MLLILVGLFMVWAIWKYRRRDGQQAAYEPENKRLEWILTIVTTIGVVGMLAPGLIVWEEYVHVPDDAREIEIIGQQWSWSYRLPGEDGVLGVVDTRFMSVDNPFGMDPDDPYGADDVLVERGALHLLKDQPVKVLLRSRDDESSGVFGLNAMPVRRPDGGVSRLGEVAEVARESGESVIRRVDSARAITVFADVDSARVLPDEVIAQARNRFLPALTARFPGYDFRVTGVAGEAQESQATLTRNGLLAVMLIFVLLAVPLGSWTQPFIILAAIPFGLAGAVYGHLIMGLPLEMMSFFGMAPLIGIVVNDALVMLDFINKTRARGLSARESAMEAGPARFRAIVLTSVTTCAGVAPLIAGSSFQAALLIPMAVSLAFGVAFATLVTLFLVPVLYSLASDVTPVLSRPRQIRAGARQ